MKCLIYPTISGKLWQNPLNKTPFGQNIDPAKIISRASSELSTSQNQRDAYRTRRGNPLKYAHSSHSLQYPQLVEFISHGNTQVRQLGSSLFTLNNHKTDLAPQPSKTWFHTPSLTLKYSKSTNYYQ